jgi:Ti-type conjugative transfer relaxase TraA
MMPRLKTGKGVTGAVRYVLGEGRDHKTGELKELAPGAQSRVAWMSGTGFGFDIANAADADLARRMMEFDALNQKSRTKQCEDDCLHLTLAWARGETPGREEMERAAKSALEALGMGNARALFVAHNDEDYSHVHIVASKINPDTGLTYDLAKSYRTLSKWALDYEREHGGIQLKGREDMNELREAIAARDAGRVLEAMTRQRATFTGAELDRALQKEIYAKQGADAGEKRSVELARAQFADKILDHAEAVHLSSERGGPTIRYTTRSVLEAEAHVWRAADALAASRTHGLDDRQRKSVLDTDRYEGITREQARAFRHATEAEGFAIIDGLAGTGKSRTTRAVREAYETAGHRVIGLAWTHRVVQDMEHNNGFEHASTVKRELFMLANGRQKWDSKTVVIVDEAAMLDTAHMAMISAYARDAGAKLILVGDDRQLASIERGGMFGVLKDRFGAATLKEINRQYQGDDRRASEYFAEGKYHAALGIYQQKGAIHWTRTQGEARGELLDTYARDVAAAPDKSRFIFAYTNRDVAELNQGARAVHRKSGQLGADHQLDSADGRLAFAAGDRIQFTKTDKKAGIYNGTAGTVREIEGSRVTVEIEDGKKISFDSADFRNFRHGYAGTIYKGQGATVDQSYLYHSEHWRASASYVGMTRHREKAELFAATNTAADIDDLARQMSRLDEGKRYAANHFHHRQHIGPVRPLTADETVARFATPLPRSDEAEKDSSKREPGEAAERRTGSDHARHYNPRPKPPWPSLREKRQAQPSPAAPEAVERETPAAASQGEAAKHAPTPAAGDRQGQQKDLRPLSAAELAERVRRIIETPTLEKAERDHRVLHALEERREQLGKNEPVKQDNERPAAPAQEPEKTQSSAERDRKEADYVAGKQEMTDAKAEQYDRWTGEKLGGEQKGQTQQTARSAGRSLGRRRSR